MYKRGILIFMIIFMFFAGNVIEGVIGKSIKIYKTPGDHPTGMTFDGKYIWICDSSTYKIYKIDPLNGKIEKTIEAPGFAPRGVAWDGNLLWYIDGKEGWIYGINLKTGISEKILESNSSNPGGLVFDGNFLWMIDNNAKKILMINRKDGMMHRNIPCPCVDAKDLAFDGKYLWVSDHNRDMLYRIDPASGDVLTFIASNGPFPYGICWDGKTLWNADYQNAKIYKLDLKSKDYIKRKDPKVYEWEIVDEFRNYGPGEVKEVNAYMAVPKSMDNQEILGEIKYEPEPTSFVTDRWGQKFAHFKFTNVSAGTILKAKIRLKAKLFNTEYYIFPEKVGNLKDIPKNLSKYLVNGFKYDIKNPIIRNAVKKAVGNEKRPFFMVKKIFNYIISNVSYKLKPLGGWNPAPTVLKRGTGSCSEYSFVFIAMCRAAGLPARYAGSIVVRSKDKGIDDVWHRWGEVYLPNYGWIPVDASAAGRKTFPGDKARLIGTVGNRYLITTKGGGDSEYLDSYYNFKTEWKTKGKCKIYTKQYGEFIPLD